MTLTDSAYVWCPDCSAVSFEVRVSIAFLLPVNSPAGIQFLESLIALTALVSVSAEWDKQR